MKILEIVKCSDYLLLEARINKQLVIDDILEILKKKPLIKTNKTSSASSSAMADEKGMYSILGFKNKLSDKYTSIQISNALQDVKTDKKIGLKTINVHHSLWNENIPYYYLDLTADEAKKLKKEYEAEEKEANKGQLVKRETQRKPISDKKLPVKRKTTKRK